MIWIGILYIIDQITKQIIRSLGGFYICNARASWGITIPYAIFWIFWIGAILWLLIFFFSQKHFHTSRNQWYYSGVALIFAGAFSNVTDRILFGCVIDFISIGFWPVFNLADIFLAIGAIIVLLRWKAKQ